MPLPRECLTLADGALTIHAVADRPGYVPGDTVCAHVTLVAGRAGVDVEQVCALASGHARLDPSWVALAAAGRTTDADSSQLKVRVVVCGRLVGAAARSKHGAVTEVVAVPTAMRCPVYLACRRPTRRLGSSAGLGIYRRTGESFRLRCSLAPLESRTFCLQVTLPATQPPTFRGTAARFWTQTGISVTLAGRHGAATGTLTLPLRVWPASPTAGGPMVDSVDAPPAVVDLVTWEADLHGGVNGTAAVTSGRSLSIGASDWSSPLFGVPAQQPSAAPSASPVVAATPRRASTAAPSPLAMEAGDEDGSRHRANGHDGMLDSRGARLSLDGETDADGMTRFRDATPASPSRGPGSMRCATYAVRCGDVPLLRVCLVPPGPVVVCGTPLEGSLDFATASGGEVVALPGHHGGSPQPRSGQDALRVTAVAISLDCLESVSLEACTRGARGRVVRRVRDEMWMATGDTARCAFTFYLPPDATPTFDTGIVRLAWHLEFVFTLESHAAGQQQQLKWSLPLTVVPGGAAQAT